MEAFNARGLGADGQRARAPDELDAVERQVGARGVLVTGAVGASASPTEFANTVMVVMTFNVFSDTAWLRSPRFAGGPSRPSFARLLIIGYFPRARISFLLSVDVARRPYCCPRGLNGGA